MSAFDLVGPIDRRDVVVHGRRVPFLQGFPESGGRIMLSCDDRFAYDTSVQDAERLVPFLADVIAVALGYTSHPSSDSDPIVRTPFVRMRGI